LGAGTATKFSEAPAGNHDFLYESKWFPQGEAEGLRPRPDQEKPVAFWFREMRRCPHAPPETSTLGIPSYFFEVMKN
jgi:hypothetical protein